MTEVRHSLRRAVCGFVVAFLALVLSMAGVHADPADGALARLNELSQQAIKTREAVTAAERDLDAKLAEQTAAEERHRADTEALAAANAALEPLQAMADRIAAMDYMSGRTGQFAAVLTAHSPQQLIEQLALQRVVAATTADQMKAYKEASARAAAAAQASERSAAEARTKAEQAAAVRADLDGKWKDLLRQIADAEAAYQALTPQQQAVIDNAVPPPAPAPPAEPAPPADPGILAMPGPPPNEIAPPVLAAAAIDIPEALPMGVAPEAGLQPNTVYVARAISAMFPQIREIGGVRPDSKPWHPSGLAIDVMIPNHSSPEGIALGNEIMNFVLSNAARFGIQDVIWRGTYYTPAGPRGSGYGHFDHVHVTTYPRR